MIMGEEDKSPLMTKGRMKTADTGSLVCGETSTKSWLESVGWLIYTAHRLSLIGRAGTFSAIGAT